MAIRGGWVRKAAAVCALGIAALVLFFLRLEWMDRRHDEFYRSGKSINDFLKGYCQALTGGSLGGGPDELLAFYSDAYRAPGRGSWRWQERAKEPAADSGIAPAAGVRVFDLEKEGDAAFGLGDLEEELRSSLEGFSAVDGAACKIALIEEIEPGRRATLTVRQTLDRRDEEGLLLEDRLLLRWQLQASLRDPVGWRITADALLRGVRVAGDGHRLLAADTRMLGVDYEQRIDPRLDRSRPDSGLKFALIGHSSGGLSAVDYDQDGRPDLLFLDGVHTRLYRGEGPGEDGLPRFSDVTAEAGLEGVGKTQAGVFADFDNDGDRDLFVGGHLAPSRFYRNRGDGTFEDQSLAFGVSGLAEPVTAVTVLDYDKDGFPDLYLGCYGDSFETFPRLPFFARNGRPNRLLHNEGGRRFTDVTTESSTGDTGWTLAVTAADYDRDGWPDLAVANDMGHKELYRNRGDGTFEKKAKEAGALDFGAGMSVTFADYDDDGWPDLYTSNIASNQRWFGVERTADQYLRNVLRSRWLLADLGEYRALHALIGNDWHSLGEKVGAGGSLLRNRGDGTFERIRDSTTDRAGWAWGSAFLDLDNDSDLDLYVANGWISAARDTDL